MERKKNRLILASASPRRRELLRQIGLDFEVIPSDCEEICTQRLPNALVEELAVQKAENVAGLLRERMSDQSAHTGKKIKGVGEDEVEWADGAFIILGADTVVSLDGEILGKPADEAEAYQMIQNLQGKIHEVYSGVALLALSADTGRKLHQSFFHVRTRVEVFPMTEEEIRGYIATGEPMDKAGAYGIQGKFAAYIKGIEGDYYNVVGLPVSRVVRELKEIEKTVGL